jgi:hypothetical protein
METERINKIGNRNFEVTNCDLKQRRLLLSPVYKGMKLFK